MKKCDEAELVNVSGGAYEGVCVKYTVKDGEDLGRIAQRFGTSEAVLCSINNLPSTGVIASGSGLLIPYKG